MAKKEIKIKCKGTHYKSLDELNILQDTEKFKLKELSSENQEKLKNRIEKKGFWFPFFIWFCKNEKKWYYTDGTQRHKVLLQMQESNQYKLPEKFPCVEIFAKDKKEAAEAILTQSTNYGKITENGLFDFLEEFELKEEFDNLKSDLEISDIDLEQFDNIYLKNIINIVNKGDENSEWAQIFEEFKEAEKEIKIHLIFQSEEKRDKFIKENKLIIDRKIKNIIICKI